jgi:hypothetical protein
MPEIWEKVILRGNLCYHAVDVRIRHRRFWEPQMFNRMLHACVNTSSITFSELRQ